MITSGGYQGKTETACEVAAAFEEQWLDLPTRLAEVTGLDRGRRQSAMASSVVFALDPQVTAAFARATRLSVAEVTELTLASLASRYPPLDLQSIGRRRKIHGVFIRENWIYARFTRYCPHCLAGLSRPSEDGADMTRGAALRHLNLNGSRFSRP